MRGPNLTKIPVQPDLSAGLCVGHEVSSWWTSDDLDERREAAAMCRAGCGVREACAAWAVSLPLAGEGATWGGLSSKELHKRRRALLAAEREEKAQAAGAARRRRKTAHLDHSPEHIAAMVARSVRTRRRRMLERLATGRKRCPRCRQVLPLSEFYPVPAARGDGFSSYCKECSSAAGKERRARRRAAA